MYPVNGLMQVRTVIGSVFRRTELKTAELSSMAPKTYDDLRKFTDVLV